MEEAPNPTAAVVAIVEAQDKLARPVRKRKPALHRDFVTDLDLENFSFSHSRNSRKRKQRPPTPAAQSHAQQQDDRERDKHENIACEICAKKDGEEHMMLCDGCSHGYHIFCLKPELVVIPEGEWFCARACQRTWQEKGVAIKAEPTELQLKQAMDAVSSEKAGVDDAEAKAAVDAKAADATAATAEATASAFYAAPAAAKSKTDSDAEATHATGRHATEGGGTPRPKKRPLSERPGDRDRIRRKFKSKKPSKLRRLTPNPEMKSRSPLLGASPVRSSP